MVRIKNRFLKGFTTGLVIQNSRSKGTNLNIYCKLKIPSLQRFKGTVNKPLDISDSLYFDPEGREGWRPFLNLRPPLELMELHHRVSSTTTVVCSDLQSSRRLLQPLTRVVSIVYDLKPKFESGILKSRCPGDIVMFRTETGEN